MALRKNLKTWIEIDKNAVAHNVGIFKNLLGNKTKLYSVVKSNAYGHGITVFPKIADEAGVDGFCVDCVEEGKALRSQGIKKPILTLGYTLPQLFPVAERYGLMLTVSTFESLTAIAKLREKPMIHLKIDTGMHRQGFYKKDIRQIILEVKKYTIPLEGVYTHFASAKDINYPTYTDEQFKIFKEVVELFKKAGFKDISCHAAATGGTLVNKKYHLDMVRLGIGLYGLWPSKELEMQLGGEIALKPVLSWKAITSEIKEIKKGEYVGYDLTYRALKPRTLAVVPVGYWHGLPRTYAQSGTVLIHGKEASIVGKVSMDVILVDVSGIPCRVGDTAVLIGRAGNGELSAFDVAQKMGTVHYEVVTRLNPLTERVSV